MFKLISFLIISIISAYEVGDKLSYYDQLREYDVCYGAQDHNIDDRLLSFSDFNGSNSDFHVFFIDLAASW